MPAGDVPDELVNFDGTAPLFPLPNVVLFPRVLLPLHIFEARYCKMVADALEGNRLIAMALLEPGWEIHDPARDPAIHPTVGLGHIAAHERLSDGRYYLMLRGLTRARVEREVETELPYRTGVLRLLTDEMPQPATFDSEQRRKELLSLFRELVRPVDVDEKLALLLDPATPLGEFCDLVAYALRLPPEHLQEILNERNIERRSDLVLARLAARHRSQGGQPPRGFPPPFSAN